MAIRHYVENLDGWTAPDAASDDQWIAHNLSQYGVPPSAVVEIAVSNPRNNLEYWAGVRQVGSSLDRRFQIAESENFGDHLYTTFVQTDASGNIEYYSDTFEAAFPAANAPNFRLVGWWVGCEYVEKFQSFTATSASGWEGYALDTYGVSGTQIVDISMSNISNNTGLYVGVRASGSSVDRKFSIKEAEGGGRVLLSLLTMSSGDTAAVDIYTEHTVSGSFHLMGYFTIPPGDYVEQVISFPKPAVDTIWEELDVGSSGVPNSAVTQFALGQSNGADENSLGVRETSSTLDRLLPLDESETDGVTPGTNWGSMHAKIDSSGYLEYRSNDVSDDQHFIAAGYWTNFVNSSTPFSLNAFVNCFIEGLNPFVHYHEEEPGLFNITPIDTWVEYDLAGNFSIPVSTTTEPVVAEISIMNMATAIAYSGGLRSVGSSDERRFLLHDAEGNGGDFITLLVPVDSAGKIEAWAGNATFLDFYVIGYWHGAAYVDTHTPFQTDADDTWTNYDLGSAYQDKVVEIVVTNANSVHQSGGVRSVGNSDHRVHKINKAETGLDHVTMHVNASGSNGAIQVYSSVSGDVTFTLAGYWESPPGTYNETFTDVGPLTSSAAWEAVDIGVATDAVAEIVIEQRNYLFEVNMGTRSIGSNQSRLFQVRETDLAAGNLAADMIRTFVNVASGTSVELYAQNFTYAHAFRLIGYWDNLAVIMSPSSGEAPLYISGIPGFISTSGSQGGQYPSGVSLYMYGIHTSPPCDLFINGHGYTNTSGDLYTFGANIYRTDAEFSVDYPSGLSCYTAGSGIVSQSGQFNLFTTGIDSLTASGDLFIEAHGSVVESGNLFLKTIEQSTGQITLYLHNLIDSGSGLIREEDAVFYLSRRVHTHPSNTIERVNNIEWTVNATFIDNESFIGQSGATSTVGDGTLPKYNDMGGGFASCLFGQSLVGDVPLQQYLMGNVLSPQDYQYAGSGSITTAFWMSGSKTSGNVIEAGWFYNPGSRAYNDHTVGVKIGSGNELQVRTSVRDLPYDQLVTGSGWWGGTTHYGTPTGSSWTWRSPTEYWAWNEQWPEVSISHNDTAFFVVRSEFIASGVDGSAPNHMKVYLSVDGQPWTYIGSGITGPPASSLYNAFDPRNRWAEDSVGARMQATNFVADEESLGINEIVLWTDSAKMTSDELSSLYGIVQNYYRPLDEYKPTIIPATTYVRRTVGPFAYEPIVPNNNYNPGEIGSGLLVTLEVGLGAYGEDSSAYLLEEKPPSGFYIRNITPSVDISYPLQSSRPITRQQIFHDPQSGIMQPTGNLGVNSYGASIRWVNHDNHPQKDQRRSPTPTGIYTYELYPVSAYDSPPVDGFVFSGSGVFFGGSTGSGLFVTETTGSTSGTTSGVVGGIVNLGFDLYISGPTQATGTVDLYIRTQETFTSAYIGTSARTPETTDFFLIADGDAAIDSIAGIEYGPSLYTMGPLSYDDNCPLVIFGPVGNDRSLFIHGFGPFTSEGDHPSGVPMNIGYGHEPFYGSGDFFMIGPVPFSGSMYMNTRAGAFEPPIDLFMWGYEDTAFAISGFMKGPEFICSSGNFTYPLDSSLFTYPSGGKSPDIYIKGPEFICSSGSFTYPHDIEDFTFPYGDPSPTLYMEAYEAVTGTCPLYIGPLRLWQEWTLYLKTSANSVNDNISLFLHGSPSGVDITFNSATLYLEALNADYPYTAGGTESWNMFLKATSGNLTIDESWTMFMKADSTTPKTLDLYMYGHASGQQPHGNEINSSVPFICSINPDDPLRIGFIPFDSDSDPWTLYMKGNPGHFGIVNFYVSGSAPISYSASGNLFIRGLFEQQTGTATLYLMGVSGIINNGPGGVPLYIYAGSQVYNTSGNLYLHGY